MVSDTGSIEFSILQHLQKTLGKTPSEATAYDWRMSLSLYLRDQVVEPWLESNRLTYERKGKRVYYLSMEFLIGRLIEDVAVNLSMEDQVRQAMENLGQDYKSIVSDEPDAALGNGGLGRLAACFMDSMATLGIPAYGYGIRYEHGLFEQHFEDGMQVEAAETWLAQRNAWEFERPEVAYPIGFGGELTVTDNRTKWQPAEIVNAAAYDTPVLGWQKVWANTLRLWAAKPTVIFDLNRFNEGDYAAANAPESVARTLSRVLYPDDTTHEGKILRLKQEYFFTAASLQDIIRRFLSEGHKLDNLSDHIAIQLNDTHPAIAGPELVRLLVDEHEMPVKQAIKVSKACLNYTNHTLLPEALERWPEHLFASVLPRHFELIKLIESDSQAANNHSVNVIEHHSVKMGELAFLMANKVNGVSALHTELQKETVFSELHNIFPEQIVNRTNGITPRRWLYSCNPGLRNLINQLIGDKWPAELEQLSQLEKHIEDNSSVEAFASVKMANKVRLASWLTKNHDITVNPDAMFDIQIKRMHEYKRQLLNILEAIALWNAIKMNPNGNWVPRVKVFGGKAAPGYQMAKSIIRLINDVANTINNDRHTKEYLQIVFPENYNVSMAEMLIPAADLSEQISTAGMEASGTGNMKLSLNGALTIGTLDGANVEIREFVGEENFFLFGMDTAEVSAQRSVQGHAIYAIEACPQLKQVLQQIGSGVFSGGDTDRYTGLLSNIHDHDYFLVASDFADYYCEQRKVDKVFSDKRQWSSKAMLNTARMGWFSSDRTIQGYADEIWRTKSLIN